MYDIVVGTCLKVSRYYYKMAKCPMVLEAYSTGDRNLVLAIADLMAIGRECTCVRMNVHCVYIHYQIVVEFYL